MLVDLKQKHKRRPSTGGKVLKSNGVAVLDQTSDHIKSKAQPTNQDDVASSTDVTDLQFGSASIDGSIAGPWITGSGGVQTITLTATSSTTEYDQYTFLRDDGGEWKEASNYSGNQNGLQTVNTLTQELNTGVYRYLLLAVSTSNLKTRIKTTTVVINPNEL